MHLYVFDVLGLTTADLCGAALNIMSRSPPDNPLTPAPYDSDATSLRPALDQPSDSEEELLAEKSRNTLELNNYDASLLRDEEERENLLTKKGPFQGMKNVFKGPSSDAGLNLGGRGVSSKRRKQRRGSTLSRKGNRAAEGQLMFEVEEGYKNISSRSSSSDSLHLGQEKWNRLQKQVSQLSDVTAELTSPAACTIYMEKASIPISDHCSTFSRSCFWCI